MGESSETWTMRFLNSEQILSQLCLDNFLAMNFAFSPPFLKMKLWESFNIRLEKFG